MDSAQQFLHQTLQSGIVCVIAFTYLQFLVGRNEKLYNCEDQMIVEPGKVEPEHVTLVRGEVRLCCCCAQHGAAAAARSTVQLLLRAA
jgi:hypothetical protein